MVEIQIHWTGLLRSILRYHLYKECIAFVTLVNRADGALDKHPLGPGVYETKFMILRRGNLQTICMAKVMGLS